MWAIRKELETRKENLIFTLQNKRDFLELEKQHQIYGAIKELNHVLKLMEHHREEEFMSRPRQMVLNESDTETEAVLEKVRKFKSPLRIRFAKKD